MRRYRVVPVLEQFFDIFVKSSRNIAAECVGRSVQTQQKQRVSELNNTAGIERAKGLSVGATADPSPTKPRGELE
jgi:hypothetical protein